MFYHCATDPATGRINEVWAEELLQAHPYEITALVESYWRNQTGPASPFRAWPELITNGILRDFRSPLQLAAAGQKSWNHLIYAYLIENTRIFEIFRRASEFHQSREQLPALRESQQFWVTMNSLIFSAPPPMTIWNVTSGIRSDEQAQRMSLYQSMLGLDLTHAGEIAPTHPSRMPAGSHVDFIENFKAFGHQVWRAIVNQRNAIGQNETNYQKIAYHARWIHDEMRTRRRHGNVSRQEFRAVAVMSLLDLALSFDSSVVRDLRATADSPAERLSLIAMQVGMAVHPKSKALFDIARPFSILMRWIERGCFNDAAGAEELSRNRRFRRVAEIVIGLYPEAMGEDLTAVPMSVTKQPMSAKIQQPELRLVRA